MFRRYFVGEPRVALEAPASRLSIEEIQGHPALVLSPVAGGLVDDAAVIIIERMPDGDKPGIMVGAFVTQDVARARQAAQSILKAN
ncbi:MAG TPA: hypothetical protein VNL95_02190 [Dehalococcoidia bacterium]|nr:hypothetical protein [Dehalococcoidia bacterium]